ncbi:hypothetical protein [Streptomyces sp. NPDC093111]|uniref:hypothetical protein n=1 Tax=Streptomyces sp. NPDC093111 TaxID=3154978 RepID=UPI003421C016
MRATPDLDYPDHVAGEMAMCELGEKHPGAHADHLWDIGDSPETFRCVWLQWDDHEHTIASLPHCEAYEAVPERVCGLYADHPAEHSWDVVDPTREALRADIIANPERYGLPPGYL